MIIVFYVIGLCKLVAT